MSSRERVAGTTRHGAKPSDRRQLERQSHPEILESKIASQAAEIDRLLIDHHKLKTSLAPLKKDKIAAEREIEGLKAHIRSIETESDIQIRVFLEKIAKMEAAIKNRENIKRELRMAHVEAQRLVREREELVSRVRLNSEELKKARDEATSLPELGAELESLKQEHKILRATFQHEKAVNIQEVEQLKAMERNLIWMVKEIEKLRAEIVDAGNSTIGNNSCLPCSGFSHIMC